MRSCPGLPEQPNRQELESSASVSANRYLKMISSFVSHGLLLENTRATQVHTNQNTEKRRWHEDCQITPSDGRGKGLVTTQLMPSYYCYYTCYHWVLPNHLLARGKSLLRKVPRGSGRGYGGHGHVGSRAAPLGPTEGVTAHPGTPPAPPSLGATPPALRR